MGKKFDFIINNEKWLINVGIEHPDLEEDDDAVVKLEEKAIYFKDFDVPLKLILHELWHVYFDTCCLSSVKEFRTDDIEEITAVLFETHALKIVEKAKHILEKINKLNETN